ncbi:MAG: hypothetical protein U0840_22920 [Gemmataceae bacterium]
MVTLFSWGYFGWGNGPTQLIHAVDRVEQQRGYRPPGFIDTRIRRSVRARAFQGNTFGDLLGETRYTWVQELGNENILSGEPGITLRNPAAVEALLDRVARQPEQRLLFFCSCQWPFSPEGERCHRTEIATCLLAAARKRQQELEVVEWPGGERRETELEVSSAFLRVARQGRSSVPLGDGVPSVEWLALPWGSVVHLRAGREAVTRLGGPARFFGGQWSLPLFPEYQPDEGSRFRREHGLEARTLANESGC